MTTTNRLSHLSKSKVNEIIDLAAKVDQSAQDYKELSPERRALIEALESLTYAQQKELCALMWLGRYDKDEDNEFRNFAKLKDETESIPKEAIAGYLFEKPLKDALLNGLKKL
ncbi:MAG: DUF3775 domain-containing protein [Gammaproteobacteria bacterium]|nr:DUF3775 domain-containing protein [Gammaproteobacteria bacterium]MBU1557207.1 DUF3775 domain-containing protein [Gammaproteobacteria bacterium]MBU2069817.1 DUF3775 domain-containing protein [Gammaproteobacteria bacterium]MBU2185152.1 DUF3775 domain-containing protein [Gammaproteobacteria bacterium]MBU2203736.1 DUF3775 domain-containing protein [Gammaproteobacteria bacterium]